MNSVSSLSYILLTVGSFLENSFSYFSLLGVSRKCPSSSPSRIYYWRECKYLSYLNKFSGVVGNYLGIPVGEKAGKELNISLSLTGMPWNFRANTFSRYILPPNFSIKLAD